MKKSATRDMVQRVRDEAQRLGFATHQVPDGEHSAVGLSGNRGMVNADRFRSLDGVEDVVDSSHPYRLASRESHPEDTVVQIGNLQVGGGNFAVMAGPCSVESREQAFAIAEHLSQLGVTIFRGGAFKPRTSPYSFQGLGREGLEILAEVRERFGLRIVTEAIDTDTIETVAEYTDIIQIGSRNMQNFSLLRKAGRQTKPVLLKRGMAATVTEFLLAAEYVLAEGNTNVILCERGVRMSANNSGNVLDLSGILEIKRLSHLPIIADPSHAAEERYKVPPLSRAAFAAGADGLLVEVHNMPEVAFSDGQQALPLEDFSTLMTDLRALATPLKKTLQ